MLCRERRPWTAREDQLLRDAVKQEEPGQLTPSRWSAIAEHVPGRTNKDCRKRWFVKMAQDFVKGSWAPEEDQRLIMGVAQYGTRWSLIASAVRTRNSDQCAKRWTDALNPTINKTIWSAEADELLLQAVAKYGRMWSKIVKTYFPGRTGLSAKNRYNSLTQIHRGRTRGIRSAARKTNRPLYSPHCESGSSSASPLPVPVPTPRPPFRRGQIPYCAVDAKGNDVALGSNAHDMNSGNISRDETSVRSPPPRVATKDQVLSVPQDEGVSSPYYASQSTPSASIEFLGFQWDCDRLYSMPPRHCGLTNLNDVANPSGLFDALTQPTPDQRYLPSGLYWEANIPVSRVNRYKANNLC